MEATAHQYLEEGEIIDEKVSSKQPSVTVEEADAETAAAAAAATAKSDFWTPPIGGGVMGNFVVGDEVWMAALDSFDKRLAKVENFLSIGTVDDGDTLESRNHKPSKTISKDKMLAVMLEAITELGTAEFGIGKSLMRGYVSERLGIDFATSQYYNKKLNTLIRFGLAENLFTFDRKNQLFKL